MRRTLLDDPGALSSVSLKRPLVLNSFGMGSKSSFDGIDLMPAGKLITRFGDSFPDFLIELVMLWNLYGLYCGK